MPARQGYSIRHWHLAATLNVENLDKPTRVGDALVVG